jgi:hypothetical protein
VPVSSRPAAGTVLANGRLLTSSGPVVREPRAGGGVLVAENHWFDIVSEINHLTCTTPSSRRSAKSPCTMTSRLPGGRDRLQQV